MNNAAVVLIVEDEPIIRMLAADMLDAIGFGAVEAGTAAEAIELASNLEAPLFAAMVDLGLPDRPGEEVVRELLVMRPDLPILITSGHDAIELKRRLGDAPVSFLEKPFQLHQLEAALGALKSPANS